MKDTPKEKSDPTSQDSQISETALKAEFLQDISLAEVKELIKKREEERKKELVAGFSFDELRILIEDHRRKITGERLSETASPLETITPDDLRKRAGVILDRVSSGEIFVIVKDMEAVALLETFHPQKHEGHIDSRITATDLNRKFGFYFEKTTNGQCFLVSRGKQKIVLGPPPIQGNLLSGENLRKLIIADRIKLEDSVESEPTSENAESEENQLAERDRWVGVLENAATLKSTDFFRKRKPILDRAQVGEYFKLVTKIEKKYVPVAILGPYDEDIHSREQIVSSATLDAGGDLLQRVISGESFVLDRKGQKLACLEPFPSDSVLSLSTNELDILRITRKYMADEIARIIRGEVSPIDMLRHRIKQ